ncbi:MAG: glycoside hydrolase family 2 protein [Tropicimonas sp.]|uniref:glycoside hydrolase family 2 protein n=1 Tax=Tropicimonas sp. TaxID=2067044 RepID=UPI003A8B10AA
MTDPTDPFAHLHDEGFETPFNTPLLGAEGMIAMAGRAGESLNGDWDFVLDPFQEGLRQGWPAYDTAPITDWEIPRDYDGGDWQQMTVPGCWNLARPEWFHYEGAAWYARSFDATPLPGEHVFLRIGAAGGQARVFLNGHFLGLHKGGSTPFFTELTEALRPGVNRLMIEVDNSRRRDAVPMHHVDWFNYGGLFREVTLHRLPACFIRDFRIALAADGSGVDISLRLSEPVEATCRVGIDGLGEVDIAVRKGAGRLHWPCAPECWSPEAPRLYDVTASCGEDRITDRVGFRTIARRGHEILLNGAPISLRGACVHEDDREAGRCTSEADIRRRFEHLRALGANAARLAHYPHHELAARIADEMGILLWQEIPVYWAIDFKNPATLADARNQLREMIARDHNRASVILWGVGNENEDSDARLAFMRDLAETARHDDPTRLITAACLISRERFRIEDRLAEHLDVIGLNEYFGWYEPGFDGLEKLLSNPAPDRPLVISETGADALAGLHGDPSELFTEERQADVIASQLRLAAGAGYISGVFLWLLYDFRSERRQTARQRGWNRKGLIAEDKQTRKAGFAAARDGFARHFNDNREG